MNKKLTKLLLLIFINTVLLGTLLFFRLRPPQPQVLSKVFMFDVGQGGSFLLETKEGYQMLIDGGKDASVLAELAKALPLGDKTLDIVLATHPDMDHIGGLDEVFKRYKVKMFLTSEVGGETDEYKNLISLVNKQKVPAYFVLSGMKINFSDTEYFEILFPDRDVKGWETNTGSVVGKSVSGERSVLFTGDSPAPIEQYLSKSIPLLLDVDILKLGHHGSRTSTTSAYLKATTPSLALISAGENNSYGHPHKEVLDLLKQFKIPYLSTQTEGTVLLETDGVKWYRK